MVYKYPKLNKIRGINNVLLTIFAVGKERSGNRIEFSNYPLTAFGNFSINCGSGIFLRYLFFSE